MSDYTTCFIFDFVSPLGFHNYHHAFPSDYSTSEFGPSYVFNPATVLINIFAALGLAWDLQKTDPKLVEKTMEKYGSGSGSPYKRGFFVALIEWTSGILIMTSPLWIQLLLKEFALISYYKVFDSPVNYDLETLTKAGRFLLSELFLAVK